MSDEKVTIANGGPGKTEIERFLEVLGTAMSIVGTGDDKTRIRIWAKTHAGPVLIELRKPTDEELKSRTGAPMEVFGEN